jgi:hypothetical protein
MWSSSYLTCTMHHSLSSTWSGPCEFVAVCSEYSDGIVGFHYRSATRHSEYFAIRRRPEPMPFKTGVPNP